MKYEVIGHGFMAMRDFQMAFLDGLTLVTGDNGAGKSSLVEACAFAFYGKTLRGEPPWNDAVPAKERSLTVGMNGHLVTLPELLYQPPGMEDQMHFDNGRQLYAETGRRLGTFDEWRLSHVLSSADVANFSGATPAKRMAMLSAVLRMGIIERAAESAKSGVQAIRDKLKRVDSDRQIAKAKVEANRRALDAIETARKALGLDEAAPEPPERTTDDAAALNVEADRVYAGMPKEPKSESCPTCGAPSYLDPAAKEVQEARFRETNRIFALRDDAYRVRTAWEAYVTRHAAWEARQRKAREAEVDLDGLRQGLEGAELAVHDLDATEAVFRDRLRLEEAAATALARDIPFDMLEEGFTAFTRLANGFLERIALGRFEVKVAGLRELANGRQKQEAALTVEGLPGSRSRYESMSGGERRRIDIALLLALGELAREYSGTQPGPLFLDEALDSLDAHGRAAVVEVLAEMGTARPIILISHETIDTPGPVRRVHLKGT